MRHRAQVLSKTYTRIDFLSLHSYPIFKETYDYWASNSPNMQARRAARLGAALRACVFAPRVRVGCPGSARAQGQLQVVTCWLAWPAAQLTHLRPT
jgi:hypothetical protein